jgi:hypothetical protein
LALNVLSAHADIVDRPYELGSNNRLRVALARLVARTIETYNLAHVTHDPCDQVVRALEQLGRRVDWRYTTGGEEAAVVTP